jgi:diguanylate cyclase (GGDEF)-like protein
VSTWAGKTNRQKIFHQLVKVAVFLVMITIVVTSFFLLDIQQIINQLEMKTYDLRSQMNQKKPSKDIVIIEFDDLSFNLLSDEFGLWPWSRSVHARMITYLNQLPVKTILYDIMFVSHRKGDEAGDQKLIDVFHKYDNVYLGMNFDNNLLQNKKLGKDITPQDVNTLKPLSIDLTSRLNNSSGKASLDLITASSGEVFFRNDHLYFNHYRGLMPGLLSKKSNIGFINHGNDDDGVSRANPLFFGFRYQPFIKTEKLPLRLVKGRWLDQEEHWVNPEGYYYQKSIYNPIKQLANKRYVDSNPQGEQPVTADGYLLSVSGSPVFLHTPVQETLYFPYMGLQALLDMQFPNEKVQFSITPEGILQFKDYAIPLRENGDFLLSWHNYNTGLEETRDLLQKIKIFKQKTLDAIHEKQKAHSGKGASWENENDIKLKKQLLDRIIQKEKHLNSFLVKGFRPKPYRMISAWDVIRAMKNREAGLPLSKADKALEIFLKNKIVFIGATAVAAYDLKNTSIDFNMPGVIMQANLFDNLYQLICHHKNSVLLHQGNQTANLWINVLLTLLVVLLALRLKSVLVSLMAIVNIGIIYILLAILMFQHFNLWINIAMPLFSMTMATIITFMIKYVLRDQDYEKTYVMATTDSMTGLYNHRFFQEHLQQCIHRCERTRQKFSLLLLDIDFFKKFNDSYGHQAGDEVLRQVAKKLKKTVRVVDIVARYGGEEMTIILDNTNEEEAIIIANKVVQAVAEEAYWLAENLSKHVTISCGVSTYPTHGKTATELIEFSDLGLYHAKESGRNQVGVNPAAIQQQQQP